MALLESLASIHPDIHTREYWEFCAKRELRFQKCGGCGAFRFPPLTGCRECGSTEVEWVAVAGRGRVFSYTVVHHPAIPDVGPRELSNRAREPLRSSPRNRGRRERSSGRR